MKSHLWTKPRDSRCTFIGGLRARVTIGNDRGALQPAWAKNPGKIEPSAEPASVGVLAAHAEFVAALAGHPPRPIPLEADALDLDLEDRVDHLKQVFGALSVYVTVILDDTAQNVPGNLDLRDAEGVLADLASDLTGAIQHAADDMAGRPA